jgi:hypothetical protein
MRSSNSVLAEASILVFISLIGVFGTTSFLVLSFAGLAARGDYYDRGCPEAVQCTDAETVMQIAGFGAPTSLIFVIAAIWFGFRAVSRRAKLTHKE